MRSIKTTIARAAFCSALVVLLGTPTARAQTVSQAVSLVDGWTAIWLEVAPRYAAGDTVHADPSVGGAPEVLIAGDSRIGMAKSPWDVFDSNKVQVVVTPKKLASLSEFFSGDPGDSDSFNRAEWRQWKRSDASGSNNLSGISGNRPYLIKTDGSVGLSVSGEVRFFRNAWTPDRFNLVGFGLQAQPTFAEFFGPSGDKHPVERVFRLKADGSWIKVSSSEKMKSGRAYWVFCDGPSAYMGPVAVGFDNDAIGTLNFGGPGDSVSTGSGASETEHDLEELVFSNLGDGTATPSLDLVVSSGEGLSLRVITPATDRLGYDLGNQVDSAPGAGGSSSLDKEIEPQMNLTLSLGARRSWVSGASSRTNIYRLGTGTKSASFWLPVIAVHEDLNSQDSADVVTTEMSGLWVGEAVVDSVTSIVEDGAPARPAAGSAPIRILLHASGTKTVLLSSVTVMQTKTADSDVAPVPVLVVDPARIPFFEGIKERNGNKVGLRVEGVAYDMPRKLDAASQDALLNDVAYPDLKEEGISDFLLARAGRPPSLAETYHHSWPMDGSLGAGESVTTTLSLDPFHRSNPFRHAFHHSQVKGPAVTRVMTIAFDAEQSLTGRLEGSFHETIQGLIKSDLELSGRVVFERISTVATLEGDE